MWGWSRPVSFPLPSFSLSLPSKALLSCSCQATELFELKGQQQSFEIAAFAPSSLLFQWLASSGCATLSSALP